MKFYVDDTLCYVGENIVPKKSVYVRYPTDTTVNITDTFSGNQYNDTLITTLKKSGDVAYTNKTDLDSALPDFY
jgi:hypothetical protein